MEPKSKLPRSQKPATGPCPNPSHFHASCFLVFVMRFQVVPAASMKMTAVLAIAPNLAETGRRFRRAYCLRHEGSDSAWRWRQYVSPKRWYLPAVLHSAKIHNNIIIILIIIIVVVITSNILWLFCYLESKTLSVKYRSVKYFKVFTS
jgi:hypothetical protein